MTVSKKYEFLTARADVQKYVQAIVAAADTERNAFGFLPGRAYEEFALKGRLIVAIERKSGDLAGYVAYGGTAPQARIFQTYVVPHHRRSGLARALVERVIQRAEDDAFLSIRVEIASDLFDASEFYNSCGFRRVREKAGGQSTGRLIITRVRELRSPSLLDFADYGAPEGPPIRLSLPTTANPQLYLVDLNVYFDVIKRRANALGAGRVFAAALDNAVSLGVASEFVTELERHSRAGAPDPVLELALTLPRLRPPTKVVARALVDELAPAIFPERTAAGKLTDRDKSDLAHLATAIDQNAAGFITSEKAILRCADWLQNRHGIDVLSPDVFGKRFTASTRLSQAYQVRLLDRDVGAGELKHEQHSLVSDFLVTQDVPSNVIRSALTVGSSVSPRRLVCVQSDDTVVAFASWSPPRGVDRFVRLYLFADETSPLLDTAVDYLVDAAARHVSVDGATILHVTLPADHLLTRARLIALGFRPPEHTGARAGELLKLCLGSVVTENNWGAIRDQLRRVAKVELPGDSPIYTSHDDEIVLTAPSGQQASAALWELEEFISPCIFALQGRPAAIVPIRPSYAEALFRGSIQPSFLNNQQAALLRKRGYIGNASTYSQIPENGLIVFYESLKGGQGRAAATAIARVVRRYLAPEGVAERLASEKGVLSAKEVRGIAKGRQVCVTEFDSLMMFERPVPLAKLKVLGCADDSNVVTARRLTPSSIEKLVAEGAPRCFQ